jgi:hypothetical protein
MQRRPRSSASESCIGVFADDRGWRDFWEPSSATARPPRIEGGEMWISGSAEEGRLSLSEWRSYSLTSFVFFARAISGGYTAR